MWSARRQGLTAADACLAAAAVPAASCLGAAWHTPLTSRHPCLADRVPACSPGAACAPPGSARRSARTHIVMHLRAPCRCKQP